MHYWWNNVFFWWLLRCVMWESWPITVPAGQSLNAIYMNACLFPYWIQTRLCLKGCSSVVPQKKITKKSFKVQGCQWKLNKKYASCPQNTLWLFYLFSLLLKCHFPSLEISLCINIYEYIPGCYRINIWIYPFYTTNRKAFPNISWF